MLGKLHWLWNGMTVFGFLVGLMTIYPRVTITISGPSDDRQPLSSSFLISNDGYLPAYSVSAICAVGQLEIGATHIEAQNGELSTIQGPPMPPALTLYPGAKVSVPFSNCVMTQPSNLLTVADVGLRVRYRPLLWFQKRSVTQEFYARSIGLNRYVWYSYPTK